LQESAALALTRVMATLLFGISATNVDPQVELRVD
jgi:hypothetical protein